MRGTLRFLYLSHLLYGIHVCVKIFWINRYISKSYTTSKNTIDLQFTERGQLWCQLLLVYISLSQVTIQSVFFYFFIIVWTRHYFLTMRICVLIQKSLPVMQMWGMNTLQYLYLYIFHRILNKHSSLSIALELLLLHVRFLRVISSCWQTLCSQGDLWTRHERSICGVNCLWIVFCYSWPWCFGAFFSYQALYNSAIQELNEDRCIDTDSDTDSESG